MVNQVSATAALEETETEPEEGSALERDISICGTALAAFACHPTQCAKLLALTVSGSIMITNIIYLLFGFYFKIHNFMIYRLVK